MADIAAATVPFRPARYPQSVRVRARALRGVDIELLEGKLMLLLVLRSRLASQVTLQLG